MQVCPHLLYENHDSTGDSLCECLHLHWLSLPFSSPSAQCGRKQALGEVPHGQTVLAGWLRQEAAVVW